MHSIPPLAEECGKCHLPHRRRHLCTKCGVSMCSACFEGKHSVPGFRGSAMCVACEAEGSQKVKSRRFQPDPVRLAELLCPLELPCFCELMKQSVTVKPRYHRLTKHNGCFVGDEAVSWMIECAKLPEITSVALAEELGDLLIAAKVFEHVKSAHGFRNKHYYYHFLPAHSPVLSASPASSSPLLSSHNSNSSSSNADDLDADNCDENNDNDCDIICHPDDSDNSGQQLEQPTSAVAQEFSRSFADSSPASPRTRLLRERACSSPSAAAAAAAAKSLVLHPSHSQATAARRLLLAMLHRLPISLRQLGVGVVLGCLLMLGNFSFGSVVFGVLLSGACQWACSPPQNLPPPRMRKPACQPSIRNPHNLVRALPTIVESPVLTSRGMSPDALSQLSLSGSSTSLTSVCTTCRVASSSSCSIAAQHPASPPSRSVNSSSFPSSSLLSSAVTSSSTSAASSSCASPPAVALCSSPTLSPTISLTTPPSSPPILPAPLVPVGSLPPLLPLLLHPAEASSLPPPNLWPHRPLYLRPLPAANVRIIRMEDRPGLPADCIIINEPFRFESEVFVGTAVIRVRGGGNARDCSEYFEGRKRTFQCAVQGTFKCAMRFQDVFTGQEFARGLHNLPAAWITQTLLSLFKKLSPSLRVQIQDQGAFMMSPLAATAQAMAVHSHEPPEVYEELQEQLSLLGSDFSEDFTAPSSFQRGDAATDKRRARRKKYFSSAQNLTNYEFSPLLTYSFDFYQDLIHPLDYQLQLGSLTSFELPRYLNGQPIQLMARNVVTGQYLWNFEVWHEKLLSQ